MCAFCLYASQVKIMRARTSDSARSSDEEDEENNENETGMREEIEELTQEFKGFGIDEMRAAVLAGRAAEFWRRALSAHFDSEAAGKRLGEQWDGKAQKRLEQADRLRLSESWSLALRGRGVAEETRPRFRRKRDRPKEEQRLRKEECHEAEHARRALFPAEAARYDKELAKLLEEEDERANRVHKQNGARRAEYRNDVSSDSDDEDAGCVATGANAYGGAEDANNEVEELSDDEMSEEEPDCRPGILDGEEDRPEEAEANVMDGDLGSDDDDDESRPA